MTPKPRHLLTTLILLLGLTASAQKLPNKQERGLWAPANVKIDGKANEWGANYQAHNPAIGADYTIANDDKNLYLSMYVTDRSGIFNKSLTGGICFVIKGSDAETSVRFPVFNYRELPSFDAPRRGQVLDPDKEDSLVIKNNYVLGIKAKDIEVKGVKDVDTLISVFNDNGIKAADRFDAKAGYVYELCIPLKYLPMATNQTGFKYQIMLNGGPNKYTPGANSQLRVFSITGPDGKPAPQSELDAANAIMASLSQSRYATTDVSGEYTLAIKP